MYSCTIDLGTFEATKEDFSSRSKHTLASFVFCCINDLMQPRRKHIQASFL